MSEFDFDDEKDNEDDLGDQCDQCGNGPVVADVGGHDLCADCLSEYE